MNIALIGYGRMGHEIERIALSRGHNVICRVDVGNQEAFESPEFAAADVAVEFTAPSAAYDNVKRAFAAGVKVVSGTTGWFEAHRQEMESLCGDSVGEGGHTLFWSSNFSVGVAIFSAVNRYLAGIMDGFEGYDVSMEETHHVHKLDAPSGTAITLASAIEEKIGRVKKVPITSYREGEVPGIHTVKYESGADIIRITHEAKDRSGLALGAVLAAEYAARHTGLLGMKDLFGF